MDQATFFARNHYDVLGIGTKASNADIERAFKRQLGVFTPQTPGTLTRASLAYETLKDPVKRRAYDDSIGIAPKQAARPLSVCGSCAPRVLVPSHGHFARVGPGEPEPAITELPRTAAAMPQVDLPPPPVPRAPMADVRHDPPRSSDSRRTLETLGARAMPYEFVESDIDEESGSRRTLVLLAGLLGAAALLGGLAGWRSGDQAAVAPLPEPAARATAAEPSALGDMIAVTDADRVDAAASRRAQPSTAREKTRTAKQQPAPGPTSETEAGADSGPAVDSAPATRSIPLALDDLPMVEVGASRASEQPAVKSAATMPLSKATIARTLDRIGYSCGSVTALAQMGGEGAFKVSCSSGQQFRAAPVSGRYRFRKLG